MVPLPRPELEGELEARVERMGYELVEAIWAGSASRPILRIRMDLPDGGPGRGVTVDQCAEVSRALEAWLDKHPAVPERYVLEVSSPGVDRPLVRRKDWVRFAGERVVVKSEGLEGGQGNRVEGELLGLDEDGQNGAVAAIRLASGDEVKVPLDRVKKAHLLFRWD
ncbi:ribosome maturation factor RimP [Gemmatimonadota bacterium]